MIDRRLRRTGPKITVLLGDDEVMFREGLARLLSASGQIEVIAQAGDGREAADLARRLRPQVAVLETALPGLNGLEVTRTLRRDAPEVKVVLLSGSNGVDFAPQALRAGAQGLVLKRADVVELALAIRAVARGETYFGSTISGSVLSGYLQLMDGQDGSDGHGLTGREREVLQLIAEGHGNQHIAIACCISVKTVEAHKNHIMRKLSLRSRNELLLYAVRQGLAGVAANKGIESAI